MPDYSKFGLQTNMPYKEWTKFKIASVETSEGESWYDAIIKAEWTDNHYGCGIIRRYWSNVVANRRAVYPVIYPDAKDFKMIDGMDAPVTCGLYFDLAEVERSIAAACKSVNSQGRVIKDPRNGISGPKPYWRPDSITGQHYDGINEWPAGYPPRTGANSYTIQRVDTKVKKAYWADLPNEYETWFKDFFTNTDALYDNRVDFFNHGLCFVHHYLKTNGSGYPMQNGEYFELAMVSKRLKVYYYNPVVNGIEDEAGNPCYYANGALGTILVFKGLSFKIPNSSLNVYAWTSQGFDDRVRKITFKGLQGQGDYALTESGLPLNPGTFLPPTNTEIKLMLPDMPVGTYEILIEKHGGGTGKAEDSQGYAGDWRCYEDGRAYSGERFTFLVTGEEIPEIKSREPRTPIPSIKQRFKDFEGNVDTFRHYAPIDTRGADIFWDGRIKNISGLTRGVNDQTGLFLSSDISIDYANTDKEFSKLLAEYRLANEPLEMFLAWRDYPESFKTAVFKAFIENIKRKGSLFTTECRDLSSVYFKKEFPMHRINEDDYPDCDENFLTKPKPEALGLLYHEADESSGAMEAAYIDTVNHIYLAARGVLKEITEVYSDGEKKTVVADYTVSYSAEGETLITFVQDQEASKITFNCKGYMYSGWNSSNGFIQHPIYVFLYILVFVFEIPFDLIDLDSFETVKEILDNIDPNVGTKGFWGEMAEKSAETIMQEHLVTIGAAIFPDKHGRLTLSKKDISNISTTKIIFAQIDTFDPPLDDWGYKEAVNKIKLNWDYVPAAGIFKHSKSELEEDAIEAMSGNIIEELLDLKWTTSTLLVMKRLRDEFSKRGKGYKKISFPIPMSFIEELDVHDSFRLQDPFGTHKEGLGVFGRYCYVEKIDYEFQDMKMSIEALDLSYIMRQYLVLGDETALADNWADASDEHKAFAYLGHEDTGKFLNGEKAKILLDENVLAL